MLRVTADIDQMEYAKDPAAWNGIHDKQRRNVLRRIILPETFSYLRSRREAHEKNGNLLKVDEIIQEAHTFKQSYNYVQQKYYSEQPHIPSANNNIMQNFAWNPRGPYHSNKPQPMEVDPVPQQQHQHFSHPPPLIIILNKHNQNRQQMQSKTPYDPSRQQSQQSHHSGSNRSP
jgi:hypothetical protein